MTKILILQNEISAYSVVTYNYIADKFDLTVAYFEKDKSKIDCKFSKIKLRSKCVGPFVFVKGVRKLARQFDVVTFLPNLRVFNYWILPFLPHTFKLINWSIGFRVSYTHPYVTNRKHTFADWLFMKILNSSDSSIFYMDKSKEFWKNSSLDMSKVFVAPNTTNVIDSFFDENIKRNILFVGSLYKGKGIDLLINSFKKAIDKTNSNIKLIIVGDGEMRSEIETQISSCGLNHQVLLTGGIYDEKELVKHFESSLLCVSPTQGGLSVPKSMGYGVPFATRKDAITGGEIYHIHNGIDGILYDKDEELSDLLVDVIRHPKKYIEMGLKAKFYYEGHATPFHMAEGAIKAISYSLNS